MFFFWISFVLPADLAVPADAEILIVVSVAVVAGLAVVSVTCAFAMQTNKKQNKKAEKFFIMILIWWQNKDVSKRISINLKHCSTIDLVGGFVADLLITLSLHMFRPAVLCCR